MACKLVMVECYIVVIASYQLVMTVITDMPFLLSHHHSIDF